MLFIYFPLFLAVISNGCSDANDRSFSVQKREFLSRKEGEVLFHIPPPQRTSPPIYPWNKARTGDLFPITKEFFRCKGSSLNPCRVVEHNGEIQRYYDCGGIEKHSLPVREEKEFVYPILLEITNYLQTKTKKRLVITCGHRCPEHNLYVDPSPQNQASKHLIGAEVTFYVQGLEEQPEHILMLIQKFYQESSRYQGQLEYQEFKRYDKKDTDVSTPPWYNKEIFVKLYKKGEGRTLDNRHPYPYLSIQVRFDRDLKERVNYSWEKSRNYHRW